MAEQVVTGSTPDSSVPAVEAPRQLSVLEQAYEATKNLKEEPAAPVSDDSEKKEEASPEEEAPEEDASEDDEESDESELKADDPERFKKRVDKLNTKIEEARSEVIDRDSRIVELETNLSDLHAQISENQATMDVVEDFNWLTEIDPTLKDLRENHWFFKGKMPTLDDLDGNQDALTKIISKIAEKKQSMSQAPVASETSSAESILDGYDKEAETLEKDPIFGQFTNDNDMTALYTWMNQKASKGIVFDSLKEAIGLCFADRVHKVVKKIGAEEAVKRMDKGRKSVGMATSKGGVPSSGGGLPKNWSNMTTLQKAHHFTQSAG